ncbi:uncharacterized protein TRUGW13939_02394 [Talaromyces rugulosus]|uniref:C2H2-type domain-containing protein n=1 Tax=Talaromyces rugulosus TaxID=121627 RepID=A0A7H8QN76_TALRU|nr:uncharacterized protein TRUGW13939_02394 [Talaromyces rugulosus]QKX55302.1 hypothetical protein TRUGW13939_02394 [Talaromyces rugulosus]
MDQNTSLYSYVDPQEERPIYPTALPPFNSVHPDHLPYGTDHTPFATNLNRKMRLETQVYPLLEVARGDSYLPFPRSLAEDDAAYHIRGNPGREYPYGQAPMFYDSDYPSPPGPPTTDLSSIPETDRSPSPRAFENCFFSSIAHGHLSHPAIRDLEFVGYGSVAPHEIQHIPDPDYPDPDCQGDKNTQIYNPNPSLCNPAGLGLVDHDMRDDADAEGEPDSSCHHFPETIPVPAAKIPKAKSSARKQQKKTTAKPASPVIRNKRAAAAAPHSPGNKSKVVKPASKTRGPPGRVFFCSFKQYGCTSTFNSKNEWKRHVSSQHLKVGFWRCDLPGCCSSDKPNDFNRKDLFTQHLRRMHSPDQNKKGSTGEQSEEFEQSLPRIHTRCWKKQRDAPSQTQCATCNVVFTSWEERMEHMGKHYEGGSFCEESEDPGLVKWALHEGILCRGLSKRLVLASLVKTSHRK